jgi:type VI secretion system protein ImpK
MESSAKAGRRLADLCTDLLALTVQIRAGTDPGGAEEVRRQVDRGLYRLELEGREAGFPGEWVESAKYALCAFLDESILVSILPFREEWSAKPLQLELFGEHLAGEGFFQRLTEMGRRMTEMEQVIEVYYLCLSLGFEGRYRVEGVERLRQLTSDLAADLAKLRKGGNELSPPPPPEAGGIAGQVGRRLPPWVALAVSGAVLVMLYSGYAVLLHREAARLPLAPPAAAEAK